MTFFLIFTTKINHEVFMITNFHLFSIMKMMLDKVNILSAFLFLIYLYDLHGFFLNSSNV